MEFPEKWFLGDIRYVDNWLFRDPPVEFMEPGNFTLDLKFDGKEVDYTLAGYASVPVVSSRIKEALKGIDEVDEPYQNIVFESVNIEGKNTEQKYFVMIIESQMDCVDEERSSFEKYTIDDPVRPDKAGQYSGFYNLVIDPTRTGGKHVFRIEKHLGSIIVSEEVKRRLESVGITGATFESVNGDAKTVC
ncbi:hypothetical protein KP803_10375 [Vibrio sp. ZSDE26]|uniref:Immunity MXAN-0049 protein domain-containing protein n=1 Tax=Vibrio amylolyticus TaxID=2847292 RepID=A0A9X2BL88_9VIBR|nr:DUF1629 domain-containing protein [Vibrio amylolyticus]MCK6263678.1 hypothetical protein [Vibrio amylolyticus]